MYKSILVLCLGNICRSPMAEALFKAKAKELNLAIEINSAGLAATSNRGIDPNTQNILLKNGIDASTHQAKQVTPQMLMAADLILVMDKEQQEEVINRYPNIKDKVHLLGKWNDVEIPDPYRKSYQPFEETYELIKNAVLAWQNKTWK